MKKISLTQNQFALVDDEDYDYLNQYKWYAKLGRGDNFYAYRNVRVNGKYTLIAMHQEIMGTHGNKLKKIIDHIDHDTLNNQKSNMRICDVKRNTWNARVYSSNTSGFKGVHWHKKCQKYIARVRIDKETHYLGLFETAIEAAKAYNAKALELHGEFAFLNKV